MSGVRELLGSAALQGYRAARRVRSRAFSAAISGGFAQFGPHTALEPPVDVQGADRIFARSRSLDRPRILAACDPGRGG